MKNLLSVLAIASIVAGLPMSSLAQRRVTARDFLNHYFVETVQRGSTGTHLWCSSRKGTEYWFRAPQSWTYLNGIDFGANGGTFGVRVVSSDRAGRVISGNYRILIAREASRSLASRLYGGFCVRHIMRDNL